MKDERTIDDLLNEWNLNEIEVTYPNNGVLVVNKATGTLQVIDKKDYEKNKSKYKLPPKPKSPAWADEKYWKDPKKLGPTDLRIYKYSIKTGRDPRTIKRDMLNNRWETGRRNLDGL